jgi:hypothetical protein
MCDKNKINKNVNINLVSGVILIRYSPNRKIGKLNNLKVFGGYTTKGPKQDS